MIFELSRIHCLVVSLHKNYITVIHESQKINQILLFHLLYLLLNNCRRRRLDWCGTLALLRLSYGWLDWSFSLWLRCFFNIFLNLYALNYHKITLCSASER